MKMRLAGIELERHRATIIYSRKRSQKQIPLFRARLNIIRDSYGSLPKRIQGQWRFYTLLIKNILSRQELFPLFCPELGNIYTENISNTIWNNGFFTIQVKIVFQIRHKISVNKIFYFDNLKLTHENKYFILII